MLSVGIVGSQLPTCSVREGKLGSYWRVEGCLVLIIWSLIFGCLVYTAKGAVGQREVSVGWVMGSFQISLIWPIRLVESG